MKKLFLDLTFRKPIGNDIFSELIKSDFIILLYAEHNMNFKTTKFFEFMSLNKPFFYLGPIGDVANTIEKNNMGVVFDETNKALMQNEILKFHPINNEELISQNDFEFRTKELIMLLEN
jgi:Cft2 family RNA processing exonuclease